MDSKEIDTVREKLRPCPFCGGKAVEVLVKTRKAYKRTWVEIPSASCKGCDITMPVKSWNSRTALSTIDPEAIRRECAETAKAYIQSLGDQSRLSEILSKGVYNAILSAEPAQDDRKPEDER